jgi:hypothetical protein
VQKPVGTPAELICPLNLALPAWLFASGYELMIGGVASSSSPSFAKRHLDHPFSDDVAAQESAAGNNGSPGARQVAPAGGLRGDARDLRQLDSGQTRIRNLDTPIQGACCKPCRVGRAGTGIKPVLVEVPTLSRLSPTAVHPGGNAEVTPTSIVILTQLQKSLAPALDCAAIEP